ncbi:hypothetical protein BDN71DRAFT_1432493 [Pleurotus eryngii]|uniref:Uncharacterized protein n=1 Tax=Pleurotus eryngii TaxID=5323 RepID=A0A9P5ZLD2_PLEER|nr:hypothetical protein BDN71DRAFT_1435925 [Pleurotus eryngii]KAF9488730.1 hypothetical protein BDN71DRAFT_1435937 [Pleurotus eryngii]KAF9493479.1 hypothetical protein BDN71DRAFT_1432493 [Pleurotus eryngii]
MLPTTLPPAVEAMNLSYPELLKQAFQKVEAETEQHAQEELAAAQQSAANGPSSTKKCWQGSISISKLGENHSFNSFSSAHLGQDTGMKEDYCVMQLHIASTNMVIWVSVEEMTAEVHDAEGSEHPVVIGAVVSGLSTQRLMLLDLSLLGGRIVVHAQSLHNVPISVVLGFQV